VRPSYLIPGDRSGHLGATTVGMAWCSRISDTFVVLME
jgi:hypothetical protein